MRQRNLGISRRKFTIAGLSQERRWSHQVRSLSAIAGPSSKGTAPQPPIKPGTTRRSASLKQVDAGLLNIGYAEPPSDGTAVILLHGWPYDIHNFVDVAPLLASGRVSGGRPSSSRLWLDRTFFLGKPVAMVNRPAVALDIVA